MATPEPNLSRLTPSQRLRWRVCARAYGEALNLDLDQFPAETAMLLDRTRSALGDMLRLAGEIPVDD
jgi:hypothetical protein